MYYITHLKSLMAISLISPILNICFGTIIKIDMLFSPRNYRVNKIYQILILKSTGFNFFFDNQ